MNFEKIDHVKLDQSDLGDSESQSTRKESKQIKEPVLQKKALVRVFINEIPSSDTKGHGVKIQFRVQPQMLGILNGQYEKSPKGMFKNISAFFRAVMSLGIEATNFILDSEWHKDMKKSAAYHKAIVELAEQEKVEYTLNEIRKRKEKLVNSRVKDRNEKLKRLNDIEKELGEDFDI